MLLVDVKARVQDVRQRLHPALVMMDEYELVFRVAIPDTKVSDVSGR